MRRSLQPAPILATRRPGESVLMVCVQRASPSWASQLKTCTFSECRGLVASVNGGIWGTIVAFERTGKKDNVGTVGGAAADDDEGGPSGKKAQAKYIVDVLVNTGGDGPLLLASSSSGGQRLALLPPQAKRLEPQVVSVPLSQVGACSSALLAGTPAVPPPCVTTLIVFCLLMTPLCFRWTACPASACTSRRTSGQWMHVKTASSASGKRLHG